MKRPMTKSPKGRRSELQSSSLDALDMCREIARAVAAELMINGRGDVAKRLVLELENGGDGGGWRRSAIEESVEAVVRAHIVASERQPTEDAR